VLIYRRGVILAPLALAHRDMAGLPGGTFRMGTDEDVALRQFPDAGAGLKSMLLPKRRRIK